MSNTHKIQISGKAPDGTIFVVGGDDIVEFSQNLEALWQIGDTEQPEVDSVLNKARSILASQQTAPLYAATSTVQAQVPAAVVQGPWDNQPATQTPAPPVPASPVQAQHVTADGKVLLNVPFAAKGQIKAMGGRWNSDVQNPWTGKKGCWSVNPQYDSAETVQAALAQWGS